MKGSWGKSSSGTFSAQDYGAIAGRAREFADGVKFDFTSTSPADYGKCRDVGCGYLLRRFELLSEALLAVKPTAILDYQCTNPYFTHTFTMLRLNDYFGVPSLYLCPKDLEDGELVEILRMK